MHPLPKLPPRCQQHKTRSDTRGYQAGCPACMEYARARVNRRSRLRAYGMWENNRVQVPAGEAYDRLRQLTDRGVTMGTLAATTGVSVDVVKRILRYGRDRMIYSDTAQKILAAGQADPLRVPIVGASRRLQALTRAGYRMVDVVGPGKVTAAPTHLCEVRRGWLTRWTPTMGPPTVLHETAAEISVLYDQLWDTTGPSLLAARYAVGRGWLPFEAWTDATIDDPAAQPYLEADRHIDPVKVERAHRIGRSDRVLIAELTLVEQIAVYRAFAEQAAEAGRVVSMKRFRDAYRPVPANLARRLAVELGLREQEAAIK